MGTLQKFWNPISKFYLWWQYQFFLIIRNDIILPFLNHFMSLGTARVFGIYCAFYFQYSPVGAHIVLSLLACPLCRICGNPCKYAADFIYGYTPFSGTCLIISSTSMGGGDTGSVFLPSLPHFVSDFFILFPYSHTSSWLIDIF